MFYHSDISIEKKLIKLQLHCKSSVIKLFKELVQLYIIDIQICPIKLVGFSLTLVLVFGWQWQTRQRTFISFHEQNMNEWSKTSSCCCLAGTDPMTHLSVDVWIDKPFVISVHPGTIHYKNLSKCQQAFLWLFLLLFSLNLETLFLSDP